MYTTLSSTCSQLSSRYCRTSSRWEYQVRRSTRSSDSISDPRIPYSPQASTSIIPSSCNRQCYSMRRHGGTHLTAFSWIKTRSQRKYKTLLMIEDNQVWSKWKRGPQLVERPTWHLVIWASRIICSRHLTTKALIILRTRLPWTNCMHQLVNNRKKQGRHALRATRNRRARFYSAHWGLWNLRYRWTFHQHWNCKANLSIRMTWGGRDRSLLLLRKTSLRLLDSIKLRQRILNKVSPRCWLRVIRLPPQSLWLLIIKDNRRLSGQGHQHRSSHRLKAMRIWVLLGSSQSFSRQITSMRSISSESVKRSKETQTVTRLKSFRSRGSSSERIPTTTQSPQLRTIRFATADNSTSICGWQLIMGRLCPWLVQQSTLPWPTISDSQIPSSPNMMHTGRTSATHLFLARTQKFSKSQPRKLVSPYITARIK